MHLPDVLEDGKAEDGPTGLNSSSPVPRSRAVLPLPGYVTWFGSVATGVAVGARWRFTAMIVRTISKLEVPVLAAMMETVGETVFAASMFASSLLPRPILSVRVGFFAKALTMVEAVVVIWKGEG